MFPKIGVPQNRLFIMENPIRMDDLGGNPIAIFRFLNISIPRNVKVSPCLEKIRFSISTKQKKKHIPGTHMTLVLIGSSTLFWSVQPPK